MINIVEILYKYGVWLQMCYNIFFHNRMSYLCVIVGLFLFHVAFSKLDAQPISASIAEPDAFVSFLVFFFHLCCLLKSTN